MTRKKDKNRVSRTEKKITQWTSRKESCWKSKKTVSHYNDNNNKYVQKFDLPYSIECSAQVFQKVPEKGFKIGKLDPGSTLDCSELRIERDTQGELGVKIFLYSLHY